jgi:hypothetical protein
MGEEYLNNKNKSLLELKLELRVHMTSFDNTKMIL